MSFEILAYQNRTRDFRGQLLEVDGITPVSLGASDKVRFKVGRIGDPPLLDLVNGQSTPAGSTVLIEERGDGETPASYTIRLAQGDLEGIAPGAYDAEVAVIDTVDPLAPDDPIKLVEQGVVHVFGTLGGEVGP